MLKRPHYIALALVVALTLIMLNLPKHTAVRLKSGICSMFMPLSEVERLTQETAARALDTLLPRSELIRENEALRRENADLRFRAMQTDSAAAENGRLRQLLAWHQRQRWRLKLGHVVLRETSNWWRTVQIDLGSRDGVQENMPVMTVDGLVGRVSSVSLTGSQVLLLGDPNCKVAARVENDARDTGVIGASSPLQGGLVEMGFLSRNSSLKPGQFVKTSGWGGIFPADIPIGQVADWQPAEFGLQTVARVKLAANLNALEEVWVLFP